MTEPIKEYISQKQLEQSLREWQERLFLTDWIIRIAQRDLVDMNDRAGEIDFCYEKHSAFIYLTKTCEKTRNMIMKTYQEQTLVHELLHLKMNYINNLDTYEGKMVEIQEHALVEQLAKSLIMAKYNLSFDWFYNDDDDKD